MQVQYDVGKNDKLNTIQSLMQIRQIVNNVKRFILQNSLEQSKLWKVLELKKYPRSVN